MKYRIQMTDAGQAPCEQRTYRTLAAARAAIRRANGGRLHGKFQVPEYPLAVEGWNLGWREGCDTAVIVRDESHA